MSVLRRAALVALLGVTLLSNPVWLFPYDGERVYTYEQAEIEVTGDGLDYGQPRVGGRTAQLNAIEGIDCQYRQHDGRDCAFDQHLLADGPVTVPVDDAGLPRGDRAADYIEVDGRYYERVENRTDNGIRYDVRAVEPRAMLAALAFDYRDADGETVRQTAGRGTRVAVLGESTPRANGSRSRRSVRFTGFPTGTTP